MGVPVSTNFFFSLCFIYFHSELFYFLPSISIFNTIFFLFLLSDPHFPLNPEMCSNTVVFWGWFWVTPTQTHPPSKWLERSLSYLAAPAGGPPSMPITLWWTCRLQGPPHPPSTDASEFHLRLLSCYIIISCCINNHSRSCKQYPDPLILCKNTVLRTFDGWVSIASDLLTLWII